MFLPFSDNSQRQADLRISQGRLYQMYGKQLEFWPWANLPILFFHHFQVKVVTGQGNTTSNASLPYRTSPAPPLAGATVNGTAVNHTSVLVTWFPPGIQKLRGTVASYILEIEDTSAPSSPVSRVGTYPGDQTRATVTNLKANTVYKFYVSFCFQLSIRILL